MLFVIFTILLVGVDFVSKLATIKFLKPIDTKVILENIISLTYVENRGAAFGILQNARWVFILFTLIAVLAIFVYKFRLKPKGKLINTSLCLIVSGALGNLIDRVYRGYVVDMLEVTFINYPVFNVADCFVVIGAILLAIYILFVYKEPKKEENNG